MKIKRLIITLFLLNNSILSFSQEFKEIDPGSGRSGPEFKIIIGFDFPLPTVPSGLRVSTFDVDATPPVGSQLAYDPAINTWDLGLRAKGIVITGAGQPVVLCSIDWLYICNGSHDAFRSALAEAAGTTMERVVVHTVHQHDAPYCDFTAEKILMDAKGDPGRYEGSYARKLIRNLANEVRKSIERTQPVTHLGLGSARVEQVASNRRILDNSGHVRATRWTTTTDSALRAEPEGVIDPIVSLVSFWNNDKPVAIMSFYASHPQSFYRTGVPNPDFPGIARFFRQLAVPDALHIYFTGAGGNIGAGKYNDGAHENRLILAERLADGMKRAWESTVRSTLTAESVGWAVESVTLPLSNRFEMLKSRMVENPDTVIDKDIAAEFAWIQRNHDRRKTDLICLSLDNARILYFPGELFVEYQLAAKAMREDLFVAMAAFGDCGAGYIGTSLAYEQGGYETGRVSFVDPSVEGILMSAIHKLLNYHSDK